MKLAILLLTVLALVLATGDPAPELIKDQFLNKDAPEPELIKDQFLNKDSPEPELMKDQFLYRGKTICKWGHWGSWGKCENGWKIRKKSFVGDDCQGTKKEARSCTDSAQEPASEDYMHDLPPCKWGHWGSWGKCENGWKIRKKSFVGDDCQGTMEEA